METQVQSPITAEELCLDVRDKLVNMDIGGAIESLEQLATVSDLTSYQSTNVRMFRFQFSQISNKMANGALTVEQEYQMNNTLASSILSFLANINLNERVISDLAETQKAVKLNEETLKGNERKINEIDENIDKLNDKMSLLLNVEIAKERITKLGECWTAMYIFENRLFSLVVDFITSLLGDKAKNSEIKELLSDLSFNKGLENLYALLAHPEVSTALNNDSLNQDEHAALLEKLEWAFEDYKEADLVLERNKFWLGFDIYEEARKYHNCYPKFLAKYRERQYAACFNCLEHQKEAKGTIESSIKHFQEQVF